MRAPILSRPAIAFLALSLAVPTVTAVFALTSTEASCQSGTCCPEPKSTCVIGEWVRNDKYAKLAGGQCKTPVDA